MMAMHITDARHFLDENGAIRANRGPAKAMAEFCGAVIAHATAVYGTRPDAPTCFKCRKAVVAPVIAHDQAVYWSCPRCETEGRISHWQGTLWDRRDGRAPS